MSVAATASTKRRRFGSPPARRLLAFGLLGFAVVGAVVFYYRFHLLWKYAEWQMGLSDVRAIPDGPMPDVAVPDDWVLCEFDRFEFRLPPEMAADVEQQTAIGGEYRMYHDVMPFRQVATMIAPEDTTGGIGEALAVATWMSPASESFTMPTFRLAVYRSDARDFRWSMSPAEARWHSHLMTFGQLFRSLGTQAEALPGRNFDGLLSLSKGHAYFEWQCREGTEFGRLIFDYDDATDLDWIRAVCRSFRATCGAEPPPGEATIGGGIR